MKKNPFPPNWLLIERKIFLHFQHSLHSSFTMLHNQWDYWDLLNQNSLLDTAFPSCFTGKRPAGGSPENPARPLEQELLIPYGDGS